MDKVARWRRGSFQMYYVCTRPFQRANAISIHYEPGPGCTGMQCGNGGDGGVGVNVRKDHTFRCRSQVNPVSAPPEMQCVLCILCVCVVLWCNSVVAVSLPELPDFAQYAIWGITTQLSGNSGQNKQTRKSVHILCLNAICNSILFIVLNNKKAMTV